MKTKLLLRTAIVCASALAPLRAQETPTADDWRGDLRHLQRTVHADYPFLFEKITAAAWDAQVEALYEAIPGLAPHEALMGLTRIVSAFEYGHTELGWSGAPVPLRSVPLNVYSFSDGVYIEGAPPDLADLVGARVLAVEGTPAEQALAAIRPLVPAENDQFVRAHGLNYLLIPEALHAQGLTDELADTVTLTLEHGGQVVERELATAPRQRLPVRYGFVDSRSEWVSSRSGAPEPLYLRNLERAYEFEHLPQHSTLYVRHSQIRDEADETIAAFYERVFAYVDEHDVERLVLDVRLNGGGNNYKNKPIVTGLIRSTRIDRPGGLYVILGRRTFSACQNLVNELDTYTHAIFVGEPTAENLNFFGDNRRIELPNTGTPVFLSFAWWQDKPPWENADWLVPDLAVELSFDDYRAGRDPALEAILTLPLHGVASDPVQHLRELALAGEPAELSSEAARLANDPLYVHVDLEPALNRTGYELLGAGDVRAAAALFRVNTELFPASANTWDSLGEATWRLGEVEEAVAHYRQAIAVDPEGPVAGNAREMLRRIEAER